MTPGEKPLPWGQMNPMEQSQAIDGLSAMFQTLLNTLRDDMNDDLASRGIPYRLQLKIDLLPAKLLPQEMTP